MREVCERETRLCDAHVTRHGNPRHVGKGGVSACERTRPISAVLARGAQLKLKVGHTGRVGV